MLAFIKIFIYNDGGIEMRNNTATDIKQCIMLIFCDGLFGSHFYSSI